MAWRSGSSEDESTRQMEPLLETRAEHREVDLSSSSSVSAPPIDENIPSPTGGIHTYLRHRPYQQHHQSHVNNQVHRHGPMTPPSVHSNLRSISLDDADVAAGARRLIGAYDAADVASGVARSEPRSRSASQPNTPRSIGASEALMRPNSDNVRQRKHLSNFSYQDHSASFFDGIATVNTTVHGPPMLQKMERNLHHGVGGSETDFLMLSSRTSAIDEVDSVCSSVAVDDSSRGQGHRRKLPSSVDMSSNSRYSPYGLPTIDGSPLSAKKPVLNMDDIQATIAPMKESKNKFVVFGWDMSAYTRRSQFLISAGGTFGFSLLYGYLQELISVDLCHRKLGLFLAAAQFLGYTILSYFFRNLDKTSNTDGASSSRPRRIISWKLRRGRSSSNDKADATSRNETVPLEVYFGLSILRAIDLGMTNLAMQYVNYPAKTLLKSTRVVFTMLFGILVSKKRYGTADFAIVGLMVAGLGMFMHADMHTSAVFQPLGIIMLTISLLCDGAISNMSESIMNRYEVGQDEFIFRLYSVALFFVSIAAAYKGDLRDGLAYLTQPGTLKEMEEGLTPTWSASSKLFTLILFSATGFLSSSCSAAITKSFGALTMSITSTARKATTIFLSFALFPNECTLEHIGGIILFIGSLIAKSLRASRKSQHHHHHHGHRDEGVKGRSHHVEIASISVNYSGSGAHLRPRKNVGDDVV